jgi:hypothetical protein
MNNTHTHTHTHKHTHIILPTFDNICLPNASIMRCFTAPRASLRFFFEIFFLPITVTIAYHHRKKRKKEKLF